MMKAVRVWVWLKGQSASTHGPPRTVEWIHYWFAEPLRLPVVVEIHELVDDAPTQRTRHELVAVDPLGLAAAAPAALGR